MFSLYEILSRKQLYKNVNWYKGITNKYVLVFST